MEENNINYSDRSLENKEKEKCIFGWALGIIGYTIGLGLGWILESLFISGSMPISRSMPSSNPSYVTVGNTDSLILFGHFIALIIAAIFTIVGWKIGRHFCVKNKEVEISFSPFRVIAIIISIISLFVAVPLTLMILLFILFGPMH
jgi:hypothetical protein